MSSQRFAVYHAIDPMEMAQPQTEHWHTDRETHYRHVADVAAPFDRMFLLTNHLEHSWTSNPEVVWHATNTPLRSTSVGDVIVACETGQAWLIMPFGFQTL